MRIDKPSMMQHMELAEEIRAAEDAISKLLSPQAARFLYAREQARLVKTLNYGLGRLKSRLEDTMLASFPTLGDEFLDVYYGDASDAARLLAIIESEGEPGHAKRCADLASDLDALAADVERTSPMAAEAIFNAAANLNDAAAMLWSKAV